MASEVTRVLREMQLSNDGGLVPASGSAPLCPRPRTKLAKDDLAAVVGGIAVADKAFGKIGVVKGERKVAVAGNKEATVTGMKKAASWSDFGTCGTNLAAKAEVADKAERKTAEAAKVEGKPEEAANGGYKPVPAAKEEEGKPDSVALVTEMVPVVANGEGKRVPAAMEESKPEEVMVTERVPDSYIRRIRTNPNLRPRPITEDFILRKPELLKKFEAHHYNMNKCVDLQENVLRQAKARGYAEVVVKYTDGVKKIYPLPGY